MTILAEKRRDGSLRGTYLVKVMRKGVLKTYRTQDYSDAKRAEMAFGQGLEYPPEGPSHGVIHTNSHKTLRDILPHLVAQHEGQRDYRQTSQRLEHALKLIGLDKKVSSLTTGDIDQFVSSLKAKGLNNKTINRYLAPVSKAMTWATKRGYLERKPDIPRLKEAEGRIAWLPEEDEPRLLAYLSSRGRHDIAFLVEVLIATGFRISELISRRPEHLQDGWLHLYAGETKNGKPRAVPVPEHLQEGLAAFLEHGWPHYRVVLEHLKSACVAIGIPPITPHVLRHTTCTRMNDAEVPTRTIQEFVGHLSIATTLKYTHVRKDALMKASQRLTNRHPIRTLEHHSAPLLTKMLTKGTKSGIRIESEPTGIQGKPSPDGLQILAPRFDSGRGLQQVPDEED